MKWITKLKRLLLELNVSDCARVYVEDIEEKFIKRFVIKCDSFPVAEKIRKHFQNNPLFYGKQILPMRDCTRRRGRLLKQRLNRQYLIYPGL